jgi:asparagine synthase (glutamine-hydrolysing)
MCGIAGILSSKVTAEEIQTVTRAIGHRGPDAEGFYCDGIAALGHKRLSIIDLDDRANQPFYSSDKKRVIVFNGEIYNYKQLAGEILATGKSLRTQSDTEVLVEGFALWGPGFVQKLEGMFAFVIYDIEKQEMFLCRDRVGKKPLFYYRDQGLFVFGSELKAITAHPQVAKNLRVRKSTFASFLQLGYIQQPATFFENIYKFPAGHYGYLTRQDFALMPFWDVISYVKTSRSITESKALDQLKELVNNSVKKRLVADVPVGIFLSGGIDSSLVAAVASQKQKIKTFSIGFKDSKFDESRYAEKIASYLGLEHHRHILSEQDAVGLVDKYLEHFDEPFADSSAIPTMLVSKYAREEVKVALTGDGGDELFLGYGAYTWASRLANPFWKAIRPIANTIMRAIPSDRWQRAAHLFEYAKPGKHRRHIFSQEQYFFSDSEILTKLLADQDYYYDWTYDDLRYFKILSEAERQALFDFQLYLRDDLLVKVDRSSMFYGLECRCPLLDHSLVEFAINLPESFRKRNLTTKYLLKKMLYELVPAQYFDRPKWGFSVPLASWLKTDLNYLMDYLSDTNLEQTGVFNIEYVNKLKQSFRKGNNHLYGRLWTLIIAQKYLLKYGR